MKNKNEKIWNIPHVPKWDLDKEIWGSSGLPSLDNDNIVTGSDDDRENIRSAVSASVENEKESLPSFRFSDSDSGSGDYDSTDAESSLDVEDMLLTDIGWKLRSGLGKFSVTKSHWERRRVVLSGTKLSYYKLTDEEATTDSNDMNLDSIAAGSPTLLYI